jgi:chromate reductase, NAD(P)H dehydrogenase (quinone)
MTTLAPAGVEIVLYERIGELPHFNPDLDEGEPPTTVRDFRRQLDAVDGVLISSPEYAHGVPGTLKNALDWIVSAGELVGKPVALINASPRSTYAHASLLETLTVMSWNVARDASITLPLGGKADDPEVQAMLRAAIETFALSIRDATRGEAT